MSGQKLKPIMESLPFAVAVSKMAPDDRCLWLFARRCSFPSLNRGGLCTQEDIPEMMEFDSQEEAIDNTIASTLCSPASFVLKEASCHVMKILGQHYEGVRVARS